MNQWERRFVGLALYYSSFSKDPSTKVGCVLVNDLNVPVGLGYNGFSRESDDAREFLEDRSKKYPRTIHAEENAIYNSTENVRGSVAYITHPPCVPCINRLSQNGIKEVRFIVGDDEEFQKRWNLDDSMDEIKRLNMDYEIYILNNHDKIEIFMDLVKQWQS